MTPVSRFAALAATVAAILAPLAAQAQAAPDYKVTQTITLGAPDRWDYVVFDAPSNRVFVAHKTQVDVIDADSGKIVGSVQGLGAKGVVHGVAIPKGSTHGYTDEEDGSAVSFDLKTFKVLKRSKAEEDADAVVADPVSGHAFTINGDSGTVTVIDPKTDSTVTNIKVGAKLEYAVAGEHGKLFVNGAGDKKLFVIDTATNKVLHGWDLGDCESAHGLGFDATSHRLFVSCLNAVLKVVDSQKGTVVATVPIGHGSDAVQFDPKRKLVLSSNGKDGTLSVIQQKDPNTYAVVNTVKTSTLARTMGINPANGRIFLAAPEADPKAPPVDGRPAIVPGSLKLLFLDPTG